MTTIFCEKCGNKMIPIDKTKPIGMKCLKCGWGWATSYVEPIKEDQTIYSISIFKNEINTQNIKLISKITGANYLKARELLSLPKAIIFEGKAVDILETKRKLQELNIFYEISPDFPYKLT